jgi:energy-coupling factor transporter transmembrane protein EcfT
VTAADQFAKLVLQLIRNSDFEGAVHQAMVSRGYTGQARTMSAFKIRAIDVAWVACCAMVVALVVGVDRAIGR